MKNFLSVAIALCCTAGLLGQKVKVKKDIILVDGSEVAIIEVLDKKEIKYAIKDLSGTELFKVDVDIAPGSTRPFEYNWMTISSNAYPQVNVVDYSMLSMSLSHPKIIAEILTKTYLMFGSDGINHEMVEEFFAEKRTSKYKEEATGSGGVDMEGQDEGFDGKIKVKDSQVFFEKKPVVEIKNLDVGQFVYENLDGSKKLFVTYNTLYIDEYFDEKWLEITDEQSRTAEVKMEFLSTWGGLNTKKAVTELLATKYNLITEGGIDHLDEFYAVDRVKISDGYHKEYNAIQQTLIEKAKKLESRVENFAVDQNGNISMSSEGSVIGRFFLNGKKIQEAGGSRNLMALGDMDDKVIAKFEGIDAGNYKVTTFDDNAYNFNSKVFNPNLNQKEFFEEAVKFIVLIGYDNPLEYGIKGYFENQKQIEIAKYKEAKANSTNIYNQRGYVIDEEGKKWEGKLTIEFEYIADPSSSSMGGNILEIDRGDTKYGKEIVVWYMNEKGKDRRKTFNSKNGEVAVVFNEDGTETKFEGIKISPDDAFDVITTSGNLSFNYSGFYELISQDQVVKIIKNPKNGELGIKLSDEEKGYFFKGKMGTKRAEKLEKYLTKCSNLPIDMKKLEFSTISDVEKLMEFYKSSCK